MSDDQHEYLPASTTANTAEITVEAPARASPSGMVPRSTVSSEAAELIAAVSVGPNPTPAAAPATTTLAAAPEQAVSMVRADSHRGSTSGEAIAAGQLHAESRHLDERKPWRSTHGTTGSEMQVDQDSEYTVGVKDHSNSRATSSERSSARIEQQLQMSRHYHEGQRAAPGEDSREQGYERHHAMHAAGDTAGRSPSLEATNVGPSSVGADVRSSDDMRMRSGSTTSLTNQAQFTFSSPLHRSNPTISTTHRTDNTPGHQRAERHSVSNTPGHYGHTPEYTTSPTYSHQAEEEDIRMSESPSPDDDNDNDNDNDDNDNDNDSSKEESYYHRSSYEGYPGDYSRSSVFRRSAQQQGYDHEQGQQDESRSSLSPSGSASHGQSQPGGVTMPAKSAVLYHAGYNSGRGAVWRFFKVVEARVSGNTDRAECLLCKKRMLGKSADMKKHIVISCPNRREISEDMRPILEIVKAELDNPKKRAKRNSNTPIVLHADGTFGPDTRPSHGYQPESSQMVSRTHGQPGGQNMPGRFAPQVRAAPYDFHSDPLRAAKMAKYGR
ncbi:hypothetical protein GGI07_000212 [Coemansia sp. Benny D115]|nr:hypothetical protein GGI07_000212 [Coemansia sp. Benny D115]